MARTQLTVEQADTDGLEPTYTAVAADGHSFRWSKGVVFHVKNGATAMNVTFKSNRVLDGLTLPDKVVAVGANEERVFKNFDPNVYLQGNDLIYVDYSDVTDGSVAVYE